MQKPGKLIAGFHSENVFKCIKNSTGVFRIFKMSHSSYTLTLEG